MAKKNLTTGTNNKQTTDKLTKEFVDKLYLPKYKPSVYGSKIKDNFTINIKSYAFESVDTDKSIKNILDKTGNMPNIPSMQELQKDGKTAFNLVVNGSLSTENNTEPQEVHRFVISLNSLKALSGFESINNCLNATTNVYEIATITIDNRLKRVTFNPIVK